ncbi:MAG TPA: hypothetical protein VE993_19645, partial [Stellaceae bacterium]|nr:hypothetical protein [Stellaceae bacterium]
MAATAASQPPQVQRLTPIGGRTRNHRRPDRLFRLFYQVKNRRRSAGGAPVEAGRRGLGARISPATALPDRQSASCSACSNRRKTGRRKRQLAGDGHSGNIDAARPSARSLRDPAPINADLSIEKLIISHERGIRQRRRANPIRDDDPTGFQGEPFLPSYQIRMIRIHARPVIARSAATKQSRSG